MKHVNFNGFTLAEILITLGIIGVVAAMTLPTVIKHHQQCVTVQRIKKFYTNINQAVRMSENINGSCYTWDVPTGKNGTKVALDFFNKYLSDYIKISEITQEKVIKDGQYVVLNFIKFADGSGMGINWSSGLDISFYPYTDNVTYASAKPGKYNFSFNFLKINTAGDKCIVEPYSFTWSGKREDLINHLRYGCRENSPTYAYCAKLIQYDGWKISDDYPW